MLQVPDLQGKRNGHCIEVEAQAIRLYPVFRERKLATLVESGKHQWMSFLVLTWDHMCGKVCGGTNTCHHKAVDKR